MFVNGFKIFRIVHEHNYIVSAVYDILPARTRALRSKDQGWQNVGRGLNAACATIRKWKWSVAE
jgi:hypothetical protein